MSSMSAAEDSHMHLLARPESGYLIFKREVPQVLYSIDKHSQTAVYAKDNT